MAVFVETVKFDDQVSAPAKAAAAELAKGADAALNFGQKMAALKAAKKPAEDVAGAVLTTGSALKDTGNAAQAVKPVGAALTEMGGKAFDAANAVQVGKASIEAAFTGIADAAKSLAAGDVQGAVSGLTDSIASMSKMLDLVVPGLGEAVSAVVKIMGGIVGITAGLIQSGAELAISSNEAKAKMVTMFDAMGEGKVTGEATVKMLDDLGDKLGMTRDQLAPIAKGFETMGITATDQVAQLTQAAAAAGAMADGGAEKFTKFFGQVNAAAETGSKLTIPFKKLETQLQGVGLNIGDLATRMNMTSEQLTAGLKAGTVDASKFGDALTDAATDKGAGPLAKAGMSLTNIWAKAQESISKMFEGIDVGPFLAQVKSLFDVFGQAQPSGQAMTAGIGGFFKSFFATLTEIVPMVKHFFLDMVILALKAYIALKPVAQAVTDFVSSAMASGEVQSVLSAIVSGFEALGLAVGIIVVAAVAFVGALIGIQVAIVAAGLAVIGFVGDAGAALTGWVTSAAQTAADFVAGLVSGITAGASQVVGAVSGLADKAENAFKDALGIHSPSTVMMEAGGNLTDGAAMGVEAGAPDVQAATKSVADASVKGMQGGGSSSAGGASGSSSGGSGAQIFVSVQIDGAGKSAMEITEEMVAQVFARMALEMGVS